MKKTKAGKIMGSGKLFIQFCKIFLFLIFKIKRNICIKKTSKFKNFQKFKITMQFVKGIYANMRRKKKTKNVSIFDVL